MSAHEQQNFASLSKLTSPRMESSRRHAIKLAQLGEGLYRPIPLNGKRPVTDDWVTSASHHHHVIGRLWDGHSDANIGLVTGGRLVVLDMDPRNGGVESLAKLEARIGKLPEPTVRTGGGGLHWYFETEKALPCLKLMKGLDVKGDGGQVVAPPSVHPETGQPYVWVNGSRPSPLPEELGAFIRKRAKKNEDSGVSSTVTDFLSQGRRNDDLTRLAGSMRRQGASQRQIEVALTALAKECGLPVREAIRTAASIATKPKGNEEDVLKRLRDLEVRDEAWRRFRQRDAQQVELTEDTLRDALERPREPLTFTVNGLHPQGGNTLFIAQRKAGKTTIAMNLVKALADGKEFLSEFEVKPAKGRIAYLNYELNENQCLQWFEDMNIKKKSRISVLNLRGTKGCLWLDDNLAKLISWLSAKKIGTLVIDPAARAWRGVVDDENSNSQVREFTSILDEVKKGSGVKDLVLVHHIGKNHREEGSERGRGASSLEDWPDAIWTLTKDGNGVRSFAAEGRDVELDAMDLEYDHPTRSLSILGERAERRVKDKVLSKAAQDLGDEAKLLRTVVKLGTASKQAIKDHIGWSNGTNQKMLARALNEGWVKQESGPKNSLLITITDEGRARDLGTQDVSSSET
jgi:hypothetical protein